MPCVCSIVRTVCPRAKALEGVAIGNVAQHLARWHVEKRERSNGKQWAVAILTLTGMASAATAMAGTVEGDLKEASSGKPAANAKVRIARYRL